MGTLVVVANATSKSGAGHVMRCAALADAWRESGAGDAVFVGDVTIPFARRRLEDAGFRILGQPPELQPLDVVQVDGYDPELWARGASLRDAAVRVFTSDVAEPVPPGFDAVWNPNAYGTPDLYRGFTGPIITGTTTVPLRQDLPVWPGPSDGAIGVTLGGGKLSDHVVQALASLKASMPNASFAATGAWVPSDWNPVRADQPWNDLARCDAVISAASVTLWEASAVGVPVAVLQTQDHQHLVRDYAVAHDIPYVNSLAFPDPRSLCNALTTALRNARPAPRLQNGAPRVVTLLQQLAHERPSINANRASG
jgi:UDP-2,4-diacetamido-2,4,6-trideoxy-beta-L-altropyranose hydrolase